METFETDILNCLKQLRSGGTILYPTDTIWGIGCDATNAHAVEKILSLKNRPATKSFVVLVSDERDILYYTASPDISIFDFLQQTSKPTTVIYDHALGIAANAVASDGSVAIRICRDNFCRHLIRRFGKPVISTSANLSGCPSPGNFSQIDDRIKKGVDYVVHHRQNETVIASASAIIKWENGNARVLRK